ncbi:hypothetical protein LZK53_05915 [Pseudomonas aeruginosa]|uniref:hypothetical protein n=1 Tax=Pseudomonas aeruginosa TaxID=287 RepID=UPI0021B02006|nr:hypothetical protein [Pseudomonas aeruginosa]MCT5443009.1 hypothetical protein [Pseudomonas aeruginosa]MCV3882758.1 hypothetical protein [Pseudomonas aeruginosa]MCV3938484.1 hypothetical protein [Pseudomonas aeruginosa]MCV3944973.1 hypothetical protein [Pseudomonas aeruginosa]MCV3963622.1 hypothetical protein [Pseudomonas aeruginosa]
MSIDWNTAPEGATHWEPRGIVFGEGWMKKVGNEWSYWLEGSEVWAGVWADCFVSAEREATFEARPQEPWNGQGLPPVGTVCEYKYTHWPEYHQCEIRYISAASLIVYDHGQEQYYRTCDMLFRPLLTPEQIAAEERSKECDRIFVILSSVEREGNRSDMAEALYDAGYRRQEEGK